MKYTVYTILIYAKEIVYYGYFVWKYTVNTISLHQIKELITINS